MPEPAAPSTGRLLQGRTAVVTGAARGIGRSVARRLAEHGAAVAVLDLRAEECEAVAAEIAGATGARTCGVAVDVASAESVAGAADAVERALGLCDIVVPNAGILLLKHAVELTPEEFERVLRVNLTGSFMTATEFARRLLAAGRGGQIIFTSSLFGTRGGSGNSAYSASKFGIIAVAQSMAAELAEAGIRVNSVCPGQIGSVMLDQLFDARAEASGRTAEEERADFVRDIPLGRLGEVDEVADTYVYLASGLSSYVTGQHLVIDGGWSVG